VSEATTQTITQIQVSGCLTDCQGVSQVQTAQQQAVSVQILQAGAELAGVSGPTGPGAALQSAGTITQIQIGCIAQCFDVSASNPTTLATAQQLLAELDSLLQPPNPATAPTVPGTEQSVTTQASCQEENGQPSSLAQVQSASESSTTVQLVAQALPSLLESSLGGSNPNAQAVSQTLQSTWQLQIGCLLDCVGSSQTQDAQESSTTVEIGQPGASSGGFEATVTQTVWQVQIGCLVWCYGTTQVQQESTQSTVVVISAPAPAPGTPGPTPASGAGAGDPPSAAGAAGSPPAPADPPPAGPPPAGPRPSTVAALPVRLNFPTVVGRAALAMVGALHAPGAGALATPTAAAISTSSRWSAPPVVSSRASLTIATIARGVGSHHATAPDREHSIHPAAHVTRPKQVARPRVLQARTSGVPAFATLAVLLVLLATAFAYATFRAREDADLDR
jgi:hypothetical protein